MNKKILFNVNISFILTYSFFFFKIVESLIIVFSCSFSKLPKNSNAFDFVVISDLALGDELTFFKFTPKFELIRPFL
jgi:hypothetical protein